MTGLIDKHSAVNALSDELSGQFSVVQKIFFKIPKLLKDK